MSEIDYNDNCYPGMGAYDGPDADKFCFRYNDKCVNENEQFLFSSFWMEQLQTYGTKVTYYVNAYNVLSADNIYGEHPTKRFAPGRQLILAVELSENAYTLSKFGFQSDDEITAFVHISTFYDTFWDIGTELLATETPTVSTGPNPCIAEGGTVTVTDYNEINTENSFSMRSENPSIFETQYNQVQPKAGDVFVMTEYGKGRPGGRSGLQFEVTEVLDQDIGRINQLGGHYVWMLKAKRFDFSFEPGLSAEAKSDQVYDDAKNGILPGGVQDPSPAKKYDEQYPLESIDQVSSTKVFNMSANDNTSVYGDYY